jgi:hypothetical protein
MNIRIKLFQQTYLTLKILQRDKTSAADSGKSEERQTEKTPEDYNGIITESPGI